MAKAEAGLVGVEVATSTITLRPKTRSEKKTKKMSYRKRPVKRMTVTLSEGTLHKVAKRTQSAMPMTLFTSQWPEKSHVNMTAVAMGTAIQASSIVGGATVRHGKERSCRARDSENGQRRKSREKKPETAEKAVRITPMEVRKKKRMSMERVAMSGKARARGPSRMRELSSRRVDEKEEEREGGEWGDLKRGSLAR